MTTVPFRALLGAAVSCCALAAQGATITVTTTAMTFAADGQCSLEEALLAAETDIAVNECPAGAGADTIVLGTGLVYSGSASTADAFYGPSMLGITTSIEIIGNGSVIERAAAAPDARVLRVGGGTATLRNLTLRGGRATDPAPAGNLGGAIFLDFSTVQLDRVTLVGNFAGRGSAIVANNGGTLNAVNSAFTGNTGPEGVTLFANGSVTNLANVTVTGNSSPFGLAGVSMGPINMRHVTADANTVFTTNTNPSNIVGNVFFVDCGIGGFTALTAADNVGPASCPGTVSTDTSGFLPAGSYGGPTTTRALVPPSPAVNGNPDCTYASTGANSLFAHGAPITTDQRGFPRAPGACDIGAYEAAAFSGSAALAQATRDVAYLSGAFTVSGGTAPYGAASVVSGALPAGMNLNSSPAGAHELVGTPTATGDFAFTVRVVDALGMHAFRAYTLTVIGPPDAPVVTGSSTPADGELSISFTAPADNGSPITGYRVRCDGGAYQGPSTPVSPAVISGLPTGVAHACQVFATNGVGEGPGSATVVPLNQAATTVASITRVDASPTSAGSVGFTVQLSRAVTGVDASDFAVTASGVAGASVTGVTGSGTTYVVTVGTGTGSGTLRLDVVDDDSIVDASTGVLGGPGAGNGSFTSGEAYAIDRTPPAVVSVVRAGGPTMPPGVSSTFIVTFSEAVTGVDAVDFTVAGTGASSGIVAGVSGSGTTYNVLVAVSGAPGTVRLDVVDNDSIVDAVGNRLGGAGAGNGNFTAGEAYTVQDATFATSITRAGASPSALSSVGFIVTFNRAVTGVDASDFTLATTGITGATITGVSGSGTSFTVTVATGTGSGTIRLDLVDDDSITDGIAPLGGSGAGNGSFTTGAAYTLDRTAPAVVSILRVGPASVVAGTTQQFTVTFGEPVTGVDLADFTLAATGATASLVSVSGSGAVYTVTVSITAVGATGGTVRLDLADNDSVVDAVGNPLGGTGAGNGGFTTGEGFTVAAANKSFTGPSATGSGTITASFTGGGAACSFSGPQFIPLSGHPRSPPAGTAPQGTLFPHGLFDFTLVSCTPGSTVTLTITYPADVSALQYFKYGPTPTSATPQWYVMPAAATGNTMTFSITDGALGDDDLAANGTIVDQGGPGTGTPVGAAIPTMSEWMMLLMGLALFGMAARRLRAAPRRR